MFQRSGLLSQLSTPSGEIFSGFGHVTDSGLLGTANMGYALE